ncbi:MAG: DUF4258 domain-containing protein [Gammaproteobacteria bacterium]
MSQIFELVIRLVGSGDVRISEHGYDELAEDDIAVRDILDGVGTGSVLEDYPAYPKGPSVLVLQFDRDARPIHVVWGIPRGFSKPAVVVTAYRPDPSKWNKTFTERQK